MRSTTSMSMPTSVFWAYDFAPDFEAHEFERVLQRLARNNPAATNDGLLAIGAQRLSWRPDELLSRWLNNFLGEAPHLKTQDEVRCVEKMLKASEIPPSNRRWHPLSFVPERWGFWNADVFAQRKEMALINFSGGPLTVFVPEYGVHIKLNYRAVGPEEYRRFFYTLAQSCRPIWCVIFVLDDGLAEQSDPFLEVGEYACEVAQTAGLSQFQFGIVPVIH